VVPDGDGQLHSMSDLYHRATHAQWDAEADIAWDHALNPDNPLAMPDATIPIAADPIWGRMDDRQKAELRRNLQGWHISQILHGERASLLCAGKLVLSAEDPAVKAAATMQAVDEVRHIDVYTRLVDKIGTPYPVSPSLDRLICDVLSDSDSDLAALGMQILIEGLALAFFKSLQMYSNDPLVKQLQSLVVRDEARHFAAGQLYLAHRHRALDEAELARREEFVCDAFALLDKYLYADEIWEPAGLSQRECAGLSRSSEQSAIMHRVLFRQLVPAVRAIGLLRDKTRAAFEGMGILDYANFPV
jgi:hypothetical protein